MAHHKGGLEVAVAVAEVADVAWAALERRHEHSAEVMEEHEKFRETEGELEHQREENRRLRALLEDYRTSLELMQIQGGGGETGEEGKQQGNLNEFNIGTSSSSSHLDIDGPLDLYERVKVKLDSPEFLAKLADGDGFPRSPERTVVNIADDPSSWLWVTDKDLTEKTTKFENDELGADGYLIITQDDIVDGIASFMARYISSIPQTKGMTPEQLQKGISQAFTDMERKGSLRKLWSCGKFMYSAASWGATAVGLYKNPIIVRAAWMAMWTSCSVLVRLLT